MQTFWTKYRFLFFIFFIFLLAELFINPSGEFPLNDDWSYSKTVKMMIDNNELNIGDWAAMTLVTHVVYGFLFTKSFGFSFFLLRVSTLISSLIGVTFLYKLILKMGGTAVTAFLACMVLLFNPLYFNLSNTFMTDVNFNTLLILFIYSCYSFFKRKNVTTLLVIFIVSAALVFMRQIGIVAPMSFIFCLLFLKEKRVAYLGFSLVFFIGLVLALRGYEIFLKSYLNLWSPYKFSSNISFLEPEFYKHLIYYTSQRYKSSFVQLLVYIFPFLIFYWPKNLRLYNRWKLSLVIIASAGISYYLGLETNFPDKNVFQNMNLGPETFYQYWHDNPHTFSETFEIISTIVKYLFVAGSVFIIQMYCYRFPFNFREQNAFMVFLLFLTAVIGYFSLIYLSESFFDRYHIPLITIGLIIAARLIRESKIGFTWHWLPLLIMMYVSVLGTRDYFSMNSAKWEAYHYLKAKGIKTESINAGFEINCWNDAEYNWYFDFFDLNKFDYLIQYKNEPGFEHIKEYPFQKYFPYKLDKINIFVRKQVEQKSDSTAASLPYEVTN